MLFIDLQCHKGDSRGRNVCIACCTALDCKNARFTCIEKMHQSEKGIKKNMPELFKVQINSLTSC